MWGAAPLVAVALASFTPDPEEVPVYPTVHAAFRAFTAPKEGLLRCMYLDEHEDADGQLEPLVTTGMGDLIDDGPASKDRAAPAVDLEWTNRDGTPATVEQIRAEFARVLALKSLALRGGGAFVASAQLTLTEASLERSIEATLSDDDDVLRRELGGTLYDDAPADAQLGMLSMSWALGPAFPHGYPRWLAAVRAGRWSDAADECAIAHPVNPSIASRNAANRVLFRNAGVVAARGLDRSALAYPRVLAPETPAAA
jgi:hypothetical protein